jgi:hypothetical protein
VRISLCLIALSEAGSVGFGESQLGTVSSSLESFVIDYR